MKPYLYMIKIKLLLALSYRFEVLITFFSQIVILFASSFFWKAAYNGINTVAMVNENQMLIYSVLSIILGNIFSMSIENSIRQKVRSGNVAIDFIKPVNIFYMYLSEDIGNTITAILQRSIPILIFSSLFIVTPIPASAAHFFIFLISVCLSYIIMWIISAIFGLFYFWAIDLGPLSEIKRYIILILSGSFIPIWFFPETVQRILAYLPFIYIYQFPLSVFIGRTSVTEALKVLCIQLLWIFILGLLFSKMKKSVENNILVQGG